MTLLNATLSKIFKDEVPKPINSQELKTSVVELNNDIKDHQKTTNRQAVKKLVENYFY